MTVILKARELGFSYKSHRGVSNINITVNEGASIGIIGESGAGKSTLLSLMLGLQEPTAGSIEFNGLPLQLKSRKNRLLFRESVQAIFQDPYASLDPRQRVSEIIAEPLHSLKLVDRGVTTSEQVRNALRDVELDLHLAPRYPHELSGGQRQRVAIARALIASPRLLIADEPTSALDVTTRIEIIELLKKIRAKRNFALVIVSHDISVLASLVDHLVVLRNGEIVEAASTAEILHLPKNKYTYQLISAVPRIK